MDNIISIESILSLPIEIENKSKTFCDHAMLLSNDILEKYDTKILKEKITKQFQKFQNISYLYRFPTENSINISPHFELKENMFSKNTNDKVGNLVEKTIDNQIWATKFYYLILNAASKLTKEETIYLIGTFFRHQSEEILCEKLRLCRNSLRKIKKSCLVKIWAEIEIIT